MRPGPDSPRETVGFLPGGCQFSVCSLCFSIFLFRLFSFWNFTKKRNLLFSEEHKKERILKIHPGKERQKYIRKVGWIKKKEKKSVFVKKEQISLFFFILISYFFYFIFWDEGRKKYFFFFSFCATYVYIFNLFNFFLQEGGKHFLCVHSFFWKEKKREKV